VDRIKPFSLTVLFLSVTFFVSIPEVVKVFSGFNVGISGLASVFFAESSTPEMLKQIATTHGFVGRRLRVLVVPGHDEQFKGTSFGRLNEEDINL